MEAANDSSEFAANKAKLKWVVQIRSRNRFSTSCFPSRALNKMIHQVEYELQGLYFKLDEKVKEKEELVKTREN